MWDIIKNPATSMLSSRTAAMCWVEMSASVQWVATRTDARQQRGGRDRLRYHAGDGLDPLPVGVGADAVIDAGAGRAVTVGDLDGGHAGRVQGGRDGAGLLDGVGVADGVHAVPEGDVLEVQAGHREATSTARWAAMRSVVRRRSSAATFSYAPSA